MPISKEKLNGRESGFFIFLVSDISFCSTIFIKFIFTHLMSKKPKTLKLNTIRIYKPCTLLCRRKNKHIYIKKT